MVESPKWYKPWKGLKGSQKLLPVIPKKRQSLSTTRLQSALEHMRIALLKAGYVASFGNNEKRDNLKPLSGVKNEFQIDDLVCYCFKFTRNDIEQDYMKNGQSTIIAKISSEKKSGGCDCANKNPKGR